MKHKITTVTQEKAMEAVLITTEHCTVRPTYMLWAVWKKQLNLQVWSLEVVCTAILPEQ